MAKRIRAHAASGGLRHSDRIRQFVCLPKQGTNEQESFTKRSTRCTVFEAYDLFIRLLLYVRAGIQVSTE